MAEELILIHHGIKGQKWGVRNGPPYPLGADDKSAAEKKAVSSHRSRKADTTQSDKFWTDERKAKAKKVAKGVAITAAVVLAAYGGYKLSQMPTVQERLGKSAIDSMLTGDASDIPIGNGKFALEDTVKNVNPLRNNPAGKNNCTSCAAAAALQQIFGINAKAISTGGKQQDFVGVIQDCFTGYKHLPGANSNAITSLDSASAFLVKRFGNSAEGAISVKFGEHSGHTFNWRIEDGAVLYYDGQKGFADDSLYFSRIFAAVDATQPFDAIQLDCAMPKLDMLARYVHLGE